MGDEAIEDEGIAVEFGMEDVERIGQHRARNKELIYDMCYVLHMF